MTNEEAKTVAVQAEHAQIGEIIPALKTLYALVRQLEDDASKFRLSPPPAPTSRFSVAVPDQEVGVAVCEIVEEMTVAMKKFGPLKSPHEGLGVLREEYMEVEDWVRLKDEDRIPYDGRMEAKQVAAVALRFMLDCCAEKKGSLAAAVTR